VSSYGAATVISGVVADLSSLTNVISRDGSRAFFMSPDPGASGVPDAAGFCAGIGAETLCPPQLYVRQLEEDGSATVRWISRPAGALFGQQASRLLGPTVFEGASEDGDKVFFRTTSPLTADDPNGMGATPPPGGVVTGRASEASWDLYMYDFPDAPGADPASGDLTRISGGPTGTGDCNNPQEESAVAGWRAASLRFSSEDGQRVYFVCAAALTSVSDASGGVTEPAGSAATTDAANLYLYDATRPESERWRFVARIPRSVSANSMASCASTAATPGPGTKTHNGPSTDTATFALTNCVKGTADGSFVTFWTDGQLTADDPEEDSGDIYAYDSTADELIRLSEAQGGVGGTYTCVDTVNAAPAAVQCNGDPGAAWGNALPMLGVVSDPQVAGDKIAFFQSKSRLVPGDSDDAYDVYQWRNGELSLVSTGQSDPRFGAVYKGNDASGQNVYFATMDDLSWQDVDAVADVYSAHIGGGIPEPLPPAVCSVLDGLCQAAAPSGGAPADPRTNGPLEGGNAVSERQSLSLSRFGAKARRRAARTGVLRASVRTSRAGTVRVGAHRRVGGRSVKVAGARRRIAKPGVVRVELRLASSARSALRRGRTLRLTVRVAQTGARTRSSTVLLKRGQRS
jgi:hypothetical protein